MKKTLLLIALILGVSCIFGCYGCKKAPEIEDDPEQILAEGKETYLTVKQGEYSYNITVDEMYINLRNEIGFSRENQIARLVLSAQTRFQYRRLQSGSLADGLPGTNFSLFHQLQWLFH